MKIFQPAIFKVQRRLSTSMYASIPVSMSRSRSISDLQAEVWRSELKLGFHAVAQEGCGGFSEDSRKQKQASTDTVQYFQWKGKRWGPQIEGHKIRLKPLRESIRSINVLIQTTSI